APGAAPPELPSASKDPPPIPPSTLAIAASEPEVALALAVGAAARGDLRAAAQRLQASAGTADGGARELATESKRIQSLEEFRRRLLEQQLSLGSSMHVGNVQGKLIELDDGELTLDVGSGRRRVLTLTEVTPDVLLRLHKAADARVLVGPDLAYAWLLS